MEKDTLLEEHHHKDTEESLNKLDNKGLGNSGTDTYERSIPTRKLSK